VSRTAVPAKDQRQQAILDLVSRGGAHTQHDIATALSRRGLRVTQATISRDIRELGLVRSGEGYRSTAALVRELVLSIEVISPLAVIRTPPGTANMVARRIDEASLPGIAGTVAGDDTIIAVLRARNASRALRNLLAHE
jgi:transcriptional regulator of arginine metabolism